MMNHSFIKLFNLYSTAVTRKRKNIYINFSKQNLLFAKFLLTNALIFGFETRIQKRKRNLILFIKYSKNLAAINDFSLVSKTTATKPKIKKLFNDKHQNFIVNITSDQKKYSQLLARVR
jgi:hypothetical protein